MAIDECVGDLLASRDLGSLQVAFRKLCAQVGEVCEIEVLLSGVYGDFCAFCTVKMMTQAASDALVRRLGFQQIGSRVFLAVSLPGDFERRVLARVA